MAIEWGSFWVGVGSMFGFQAIVLAVMVLVLHFGRAKISACGEIIRFEVL